MPAWLTIGAPIWFGSAGWVEDIAIGATDIMVKVESPKRKLLNQRYEWLPYRAGVMVPLTQEQLEREIRIYTERRDVLAREFDQAVAELQRLWHQHALQAGD